ncbi:pilus (MSHA type) biogenesis protein MshL [Thalassotalea sp. LPB0316]|uniref:pilus (MSHA type) biogenesis protein MshL n=1 Tax=Thalassotalea sp. LPB0316 TaxID=2769490 RepID=UPI001867496C|nr:pilus (MSHA type) biogenesis protein MshL [Thalassotalea sp. LPB0316]QOL26743.1 pilus (MSHA type) biogenesis protein MshL [Thalassotalea sp. LPB0316]
MNEIIKKSGIHYYFCALVLAGCQTVPDAPTDVNNALDEAIAQEKLSQAPKALTSVPSAVRQDLMQQSMQQARQGLLAEKRLEIAASGVDAKHFFAALVEDSPYSVAVHPDVEGTITLNLQDVTMEETIDVVKELYGYDIRTSGNVIQVYPAGMRTETFPLDYLFVKRFGLSSTSINSGGVSENDPNTGNNNNNANNNNNTGRNNNNRNNNSGYGSNNNNSSSGINIYTENESDFWTELKDTLLTLVGEEDGRSVIVSPQAGLITVRAYPEEIKAVKRFIEDSQNHLRRQVIIEAKILEVTLNDDFQQGVKWDNIFGHIGSTDFSFSTTGNVVGNVISGAIGGTTSIGITNPDFSGVIELLQTQGNVQVLSSPRITATNNQKAVIKVGEDEYFVTNVSSTTTPEVDLTPFFSGIALDVTPQINQDGEVILHVHPSVTLTDEQVKTIRISDEDIILPLAQSSVRESDTIIRARSGEIVVIGGLIETRKIDLESKTPLLGDIPLLGEAFKSKTQTTRKSELVIMLKPTVIGQETWTDQLKDARQLLKQWFPDSE